MLLEAENSNTNIGLKTSFVNTSASLTCFSISRLAFWTAILLYQITAKLPGCGTRTNTSTLSLVIADIRSTIAQDVSAQFCIANSKKIGELL